MSNGGVPTILIVDDEPDLRDIIRDDLEAAGYQVIEAASGNSAIRLLSQRTFDVIISDLQMPDGSGLDLLSHIKEKNPNIPAMIFMTAQSHITLEDAYDLGAQAILPKPWKPAGLLAIVKNLLVDPVMRWTPKSAQVDLKGSLGLNCQDFADGVQRKILSLGRGGMFVALNGELPFVGERAMFSFEQPSGTRAISCIGIVRWVRAHGNGALARGIGVEFLELSREQTVALTPLLKTLGSGCYIPKSV